MRKKICSLLLCGALLFAGTACVHAETSYGSPDWSVTFTSDDKMESSFKSSDLDETIYGMQPGDNAILTIRLANENGLSTDWYMTNEVLYSLEDRSANKETGGGAYTYILTYTDNKGGTRTLFDSDTVGGENSGAAGEGLHAATGALKDYFYLDTLTKGQSGVVTLEVALDGETQGNDYQNTLADLQMNFAVEPNGTRGMSQDSSTGALGDDSVQPGQPNSTNGTQAGGSERRRIIQTGDETQIAPYILVACVSGSILFVISLYGLGLKRQERRVRS